MCLNPVLDLEPRPSGAPSSLQCDDDVFSPSHQAGGGLQPRRDRGLGDPRRPAGRRAGRRPRAGEATRGSFLDGFFPSSSHPSPSFSDLLYILLPFMLSLMPRPLLLMPRPLSSTLLPLRLSRLGFRTFFPSPGCRCSYNHSGILPTLLAPPPPLLHKRTRCVIFFHFLLEKKRKKKGRHVQSDLK